MISVKIITLGHIPVDLNFKIIENWKSKLFRISNEIENFSITTNSDQYDWSFSDEKIKNELPKNIKEDLLFVIVNIPLEDNYYSRILSNNKVVITYHDVKEILENKNIPLENLILYLLYTYVLGYLKYNNSIPNFENIDLIHDDTRRCLYDMHGVKSDLTYSCVQPIICSSCEEKLKNGKISIEKINQAKKELKKINKPLFFRISDFVKKHPLWSLIISSFTAVILGTIGSILGTIIYEVLKRNV
jgi:hypothetical protein